MADLAPPLDTAKVLTKEEIERVRDDVLESCEWSAAGKERIKALCEMALADAERLDWLERFNVEVRIPLVHGSRHLFYANPTQVEGSDDEPSKLRAMIDYERNGGPKP